MNDGATGNEHIHQPPYWTYAMFDDTCVLCKAAIPRGASVYYYPDDGAVLCAGCAETAGENTEQMRLF
jgi:recombinational DNA repair protein (RecF pathway)